MKKRKSPILLISLLVIIGGAVAIFASPMSPAGQHAADPESHADHADMPTSGPAGPTQTPAELQKGLPTTAASPSGISASGVGGPVGSGGGVSLEMPKRPEEMVPMPPKNVLAKKKAAAAAQNKPDDNRTSSLAFEKDN